MKKLKPKLKCYIARVLDEYVCTLLHGETSGKAKTRFMKSWISEDNDFVDVRLTRLPGLDDKAITFQSSREAGFIYYDEEDSTYELPEKYFSNECTCEVCRPDLKKVKPFMEPLF